ncbi:hypothetical protein CY34DRAFT_801990 [Suillus luteus UH-Slu-Lm8-n1]|uniref:NADH dehydrogenase [ubiquinone] 1 beta subcomplex subunit 2 n=1 Tax=Suillus luteus UH-Slu-Lm8-n1 TaxID=930992 RepID=A0A0D0ATX1_9AGAM|nr:hypothetical protein P692DRAFT_20730049 [Suillus brevipes Sb2]KIK45136.1 hypothetical protein CY34DRAFT_801990 [Suillus luteus UH-Slu-Lm8-n1]
MAGGSHPSGFNPHLPGLRYQILAKALGATMWFFMLYRAREDGPKLLGLRHPWEGHGHGHHDEHSEHH